MVNAEKPQKRKLWQATPEMKQLFKKDVAKSVLIYTPAAALTAFALLNGYHDAALWFNNISSNIPLIGGWVHNFNPDGLVQGLAGLTNHIPGTDSVASFVKEKQTEVIPALNGLVSKDATLAAEGAAITSLPLNFIRVGMKSLARRLTHVHQQVEKLTQEGKQDEVPNYAKPLVKSAKGTSTGLAVGLTLAEVAVEAATMWGSETPWGLNDLLPLGEAAMGKHPLVEKMTLADRLWMVAFTAVPFVPADGLFLIYALLRKKVNSDALLNAKLNTSKTPARRQ
ncbi:MAG TPA: hypothetical protein VF189_05315 [Patescibacteria group bacterium]